ncbi:MAG: pyridoxamine 5'-phosphate oxidase family protein [Candidatus Bathyarchaeota archaeon]|nr:pyridoxamine 5'-phosphate oxidase family protein [Candidatus Bathyarchaeota archaeon]
MGKIEDVIPRFSKQQVVYLATAEGDQPRVRPLTLISHEDRFFIITGARGGVNAEKLKQIRVNPRVEYYLTVEEEGFQPGFIRGEADTAIVDDRGLREAIWGEIEWASNFFDSPSHPDYVLLELEHRGFRYRNPGEYEIRTLSL